MQRLPNGVMDFGILREDRLYYVDKTWFIEELEAFHPHVVLTRPRRFGKTLWLSVLEHYYDVRFQDRFEFFFRDLYIGAHPTRERNGYHVLRFDFSGVDEARTVEDLEARFADSIRSSLFEFMATTDTRDAHLVGALETLQYPSAILERFFRGPQTRLPHPDDPCRTRPTASTPQHGKAGGSWKLDRHADGG